MNEKNIKVYVPVTVFFNSSGTMIPRSLIWEDGRTFYIDKVIDMRPAPAIRAGGQGEKYTVLIGGKQSCLYFERNVTVSGGSIGKWFVERR